MENTPIKETKKGTILTGKRFSLVMGVVLFIFFFSFTGVGILKDANSASTLTAKTTLTVVNVTEFLEEATKSPSEVIDYDVTVDLYNVSYISGWVLFNWSPQSWPTGTTNLNGRIWKFASNDGGKTYYAIGWDYIKAGIDRKLRDSSIPTDWIGTMLSSLCHTNNICVATERTNIVFWP